MELPYDVRREEEDGYPVYVLEDRAVRSEAWVVPGIGLNLYRFSIERGDESIAVIDSPPTLEDLRREPYHYGVPVLFPFPGRIPQGRFTFGGRTYELAKLDEEGNAIHGLVASRPWRVIATGPSGEDGAVLVGRFESPEFSVLAEQYPSAFRLDLTYRLRAWTLTIEARAENIGRDPLPIGFGLHPYLRAPLREALTAGGCVIEVPATRRWELAGGVPTGRLLPLDEDLAQGVSLEGRIFDDVYTGLLLTDGVSRCVMGDTRARLAAVVEADRQFGQWVVYTPPRPAICFEPWTSLPNAVQLQQQGIDAGLIVLEPGGWRCWTVRLVIRNT